MQKSALIITLCLLISGCFGAFLVGATAGGLIVYDGRNLADMRTDHSIHRHITHRLVHDPSFANSHITVASFHRYVLLAGQIESPEARRDLLDIAKETPKVLQVYDELEPIPPISNGARSRDFWLSAKVRTALLATPHLRSGDIKIVTENRNVYLMGRVTREQAQLAVDTARKVGGVRKVVRVFHSGL